MAQPEDEETLLRAVSLRNANSILIARQRTERELLQAKEALELKTRELAHSLAMMRATLESTTDGILAVDGQGNVTSFNERFVQMWGVPREMLASGDQRLLRFARGQLANPDAYTARLDEIYATLPAESFDVLEFIDGRVFERHSQIQKAEQRSVGRVWSFRDVTERRRSEQALREESRALELLNRTGITMGSTLDLKKLVQAVTDAATDIAGAKFGAFFYNTTDATGDSYLLYTLAGAPREAFDKFGHPRATPLFGPTFKGDAPIRSEDVLADPRYGQMAPHYGTPGGHLPVRSYLAVPVSSPTGRVIGGLFFGHPEVGVFTERTERTVVGLAAQAGVAIDNARLYEDLKQAAQERERLLESEREARTEAERVSHMKDEFLATLSHELRTPLNAILGWSQVLLSKKASEEDSQRGLEAIARNARAQTQLIEDLLDMSRIVSGKVRLDVQRVDLAVAVDAAVDSVRPSVAAKGISLRTVVDPRAGPVSGDPNRLQQIVWNLLSNAVKFTPKGGKVDVIIERINSHIEITVRDSGVGIDPQFLPHVFDRFRQADSSTTRVHSGLGLGLSIVKQLVELHGGTVRATSAGEGTGATFVVALPLAPVRVDERRVHPTAMTLAGFDSEDIPLEGVSILVIDDEADARELIKHVLVQCRADVFTASTADDGLRLLAARGADVVISDIGMPVKDGYQFIRELRALPASQGGTVPAVALTAFARSEDRTRAMVAGYQVHISKPIEPQELVATIASLAGRTGQRKH